MKVHTWKDYVCPKCHSDTLKLSEKPRKGFEYFCYTCILYFSSENLVKFWGWDVGDVYDIQPLPDAPTFEPMWKSWAERMDNYAVVDRMFIGIPEWDDGCSNMGIDTGYCR